MQLVQANTDASILCIHNDEYEMIIPKGKFLFKIVSDKCEQYYELNKRIGEFFVWDKSLDFQCVYIAREEDFDWVEMF